MKQEEMKTMTVEELLMLQYAIQIEINIRADAFMAERAGEEARS